MTMGSCSASRGSTSIPPGCGNWGLRVEHQDTNPELTLTGHDELTGLIGRGALFKQLQARIDAGALPISVIFLELDHFSVFNDSLGYPAGDEMLRVVARRLPGSRSLPIIRRVITSRPTQSRWRRRRCRPCSCF